MSIFKAILSKLMPSAKAEEKTETVTAAATNVADAVKTMPEAVKETAEKTTEAVVEAAPEVKQTVTETVTTQVLENVDVEAILEDLAKKNPQTLNWKTSIVDLLKLLDMDSSLSARKELATEMGYTGDMSDSATMNIWLIKEVKNKIAQNGGKIDLN